MFRTIREFGRAIADAEGATVLVYYAGHGMQDDRAANYLIPVDADLKYQSDLATEAISLDTLLKMLDQASVKVGIVVLDACRDNPLASGQRGFKRGLGVEDRTGLFIAFSTSPSKVALDGTGANSPYAQALAEEIASPGMEIEQVFKNVRIRVSEATNGEQTPWEQSRLRQRVMLAGLGTPQPMAKAQKDAPDQDPTVAYLEAVKKDTPKDYEELLARFPEHPQKKAVMALLQRKAEEGLWKEAEALRDRPQERPLLERLLTAFPDGIFTDRVRDRLESIRRSARPAPAEANVADSAQDDFEVASAAKSREGWIDFLSAHPTGPLATLARYELALLSQPASRAPPIATTSAYPAPLPAPTPSSAEIGRWHYVTGLDPNGNNWLALRRGPSFSAAWSPTRMGPGTPLKVTGRSGEWYAVTLQSGETGWANARFVACCQDVGVRPIAAAPQPIGGRGPAGGSFHYVTGLDPNGNNWLALRYAPNTSSGWSSTRMTPGTLLKVLGTSGDYYRVQLISGETGWAAQRYVACCRGG